MSDLIERLRRIEHGWCYGSGTVTSNWQRNPDGPEAADEIERLRLAYAHCDQTRQEEFVENERLRGLLREARRGDQLHWKRWRQWQAEVDAALAGTASQPPAVTSPGSPDEPHVGGPLLPSV